MWALSRSRSLTIVSKAASEVPVLGRSTQGRTSPIVRLADADPATYTGGDAGFVDLPTHHQVA
ncbi:hypothetical protein [Nocardioides turkmenicus]|uniref:hypothetical protein n=1 Tax=Nocardioides turkmenicus TaxID=2711220 RepID=UPI0019D19F41|nr:hypothetical protein [Nocardioides sp. KC13]